MYRRILIAGLVSMIPVLVDGLRVTEAAPVADPQVVVQNGEKTLLLPDSFLTMLSVNYPGFRIPEKSDLTGWWKYIEERSTGFPYVCWGDFNGDGQIDIAIILLGTNMWKFVVAHKQGTGYVQALAGDFPIGEQDAVVQSPQEFYIETLAKGEVETLDTGERIIEYSFEHDAIKRTIFEKALAFYFWKDGKYESRGFFGL